MSKKIDPRLPKGNGLSMYDGYAAVKTPWDKLINYHDAMQFVNRYKAVVGAAATQALRILIPDYTERARLLAQVAYDDKMVLFGGGMAKSFDSDLNVHPFHCGQFTGSLMGDSGDDGLLMCGRVNDFGTYRVEKELDTCPWDICGSEVCRATTQGLQAIAECFADLHRNGPTMDYLMVEAKGCGDRHCRIVAESREKYPAPEHERWDCFGPAVSQDLIRFTEEEDCVSEPMVFREDAGYTFSNGLCNENDDSQVYTVTAFSDAANDHIFPTINAAVDRGMFTREYADHVVHCVMEAAGKAYFGDLSTKDAIRQFLGVPRSIGDDDGRIMGGFIEVFLQAMLTSYEIESFNKDEVIYLIDRYSFVAANASWHKAVIPFWYGGTKTLVNAQWSLWEETLEDTSEDMIRIKIAKKIDKFC